MPAEGYRVPFLSSLHCRMLFCRFVQGLVVGAVVYALENLTVTLHGIRLQGGGKFLSNGWQKRGEVRSLTLHEICKFARCQSSATCQNGVKRNTEHTGLISLSAFHHRAPQSSQSSRSQVVSFLPCKRRNRLLFRTQDFLT